MSSIDANKNIKAKCFWTNGGVNAQDPVVKYKQFEKLTENNLVPLET